MGPAIRKHCNSCSRCNHPLHVESKPFHKSLQKRDLLWIGNIDPQHKRHFLSNKESNLLSKTKEILYVQKNDVRLGFGSRKHCHFHRRGSDDGNVKRPGNQSFSISSVEKPVLRAIMSRGTPSSRKPLANSLFSFSALARSAISPSLKPSDF